ncbi:flavodoxin family protein [Bacteriovorax stolpii]|uniref:NADPH:quinone reductase n=1 Tax=Bacteriovorax stolpii TaxID=960 RepID=A0A2K9NNK5_BACTC|nr:NAD(P)H-dependent oxidoreductase [Bacteriovorax stolpii]AUN97083.1 NADPH:quinone reductase [Bacteriovorax stolpii]QDK42981.1 flavodoxin family protein [Bacteriovorax stolpii]TDP53369.1 putative NADPH-quinone reductase [Bacteriovorax stolpii]BDT27115.1 NAD(P)H-dependent oxidoreductase [Bacteriovorax sp. HI3]
MRTLIILGHPDKKSLCAALADNYEKGAREKGGEVERINISDLNFNPNLKNGYRVVQNLEPDLIEAQKKVKWATHIVIVFPVWWGGVPALLKGFLDRAFLPGFAFKYRENSHNWDKLLSGKSARLIVTSDAPVWWLYLTYFHPAVNMMKKAVLEFCGVSPVEVMSFGSIKDASEKRIEGIIYKAFRAGLDDN